MLKPALSPRASAARARCWMDLSSKVKTGLDEARMLVLGCEILVGFQFQAARRACWPLVPLSASYEVGAKESLIHLLMFAEAGVLAAIFLEVNALVIGLAIIAFLLHEATAMRDVSYAVTARKVTPLEQHMHSFLEMIPLMALLLIVPLKWAQFWLFSISATNRPASVSYGKRSRFPSPISQPSSRSSFYLISCLFGTAGARFTRGWRPAHTAPWQAQ
jgi:hypothetical protein